MADILYDIFHTPLVTIAVTVSLACTSNVIRAPMIFLTSLGSDPLTSSASLLRFCTPRQTAYTSINHTPSDLEASFFSLFDFFHDVITREASGEILTPHHLRHSKYNLYKYIMTTAIFDDVILG